MLLGGRGDGMRLPGGILIPLDDALFGTQPEDVHAAVAIHVRHRHLIATRNLRHLVRLPLNQVARLTGGSRLGRAAGGFRRERPTYSR